LCLAAGGEHSSAAVHNHASLRQNRRDGLLLPGTLRRKVIVFELLQIKAPCGESQEDGYQETKQGNEDANIFHLTLRTTQMEHRNTARHHL
jgi:hypothetical protein